MDGSELLFIVMPIVIPLALGIAVAAPFVASRDGRGHRERGKEPERADMRRRAPGLMSASDGSCRLAVGKPGA